jgi:segregation and condensation protein B
MERKTFNLNTDAETRQTSEETQRDLALLEAALYVAGRPLNLNDLCSVLKTRSKKRAKALIKMLMQAYANRETALEILELKDERYVLQLKAEFTPYVKKFVTKPLLSTGPLKTLSYIAYRQPVSPKKVVEVRGHHAYGHIKLLKEMGLIAAEKSGRSTVLRTTEYFADHFGLSHDVAALKRELKIVLENTSKQ